MTTFDTKLIKGEGVKLRDKPWMVRAVYPP
jgi:hypothetical protein